MFPVLLKDAKSVDKGSLRYAEGGVGRTIGRKSAPKDKREDGVTRRVMGERGGKRREGMRRQVCQARSADVIEEVHRTRRKPKLPFCPRLKKQILALPVMRRP